ncbi:putative protein kinase RLK-Pelle-URK-Pp-1 family [Helianthus anomalus]
MKVHIFSNLRRSNILFALKNLFTSSYLAGFHVKLYLQSLDKSTGSTEILHGPRKYSYGDLKIGTYNFSDEHNLGGGVFGEVYKGSLKDGNTVAIKKTAMASISGKMQELKIISNVHHRHLVRLLGYCNKGPFYFWSMSTWTMVVLINSSMVANR